MTWKNSLAWAALMIGALTIMYTYAPSGDREPFAVDKRVAAANFKLTDSNGKEVQLSEYKDKVVLLNFWATWCGPCQVEIPWFTEFEKTYKDRGFAVIGVSSDEGGWSAVRPFMEARKMNYRVALEGENMPAPYSQIEALPTTYLIDRQGRIAKVHTGLVSRGTYEYGIEKLLAN